MERTLEEARAAEEKARLALGEAQQQVSIEAEKAREAEGELRGVKEKLKEAEGEIYAQEGQIFDLRAQAREAQERASNAVQLAHYADVRAETLAQEMEAFKEKAAEEAKINTAEAERRIAEAIAAFRQSAAYRREVLDTTAQSYDLGFRDCKSKAMRVSTLEEIEGLEPDSTEDSAPSSPDEPRPPNDLAPTEP